jgi:hypothetical protein
MLLCNMAFTTPIAIASIAVMLRKKVSGELFVGDWSGVGNGERRWSGVVVVGCAQQALAGGRAGLRPPEVMRPKFTVPHLAGLAKSARR